MSENIKLYSVKKLEQSVPVQVKKIMRSARIKDRMLFDNLNEELDTLIRELADRGKVVKKAKLLSAEELKELKPLQLDYIFEVNGKGGDWFVGNLNEDLTLISEELGTRPRARPIRKPKSRKDIDKLFQEMEKNGDIKRAIAFDGKQKK